jgi:hypothetical protein
VSLLPPDLRVNNQEVKLMKKLWGWISEFWCNQVHAAPMWPVHGKYECRVCHRVHEVGWANQG